MTMPEAADFPVLIKHGKIYWSAGIIAALSAGLASFAIARAQIADLSEKQMRLEQVQSTLATKADLKDLQNRLDQIFTMMAERQQRAPR